MKKFFLLIALLLAAPAQAEVIKQFESDAGEEKVTFLLRVAKWMDGWTRQYESEACGYITEKDGRYSIVLETVHKQQECWSTTIQHGWALTGDNIHSHPRIRMARGYKRSVKSNFSDVDYETPGYLVANGQLFYQRGVGTDTTVAALP